MRFQLTPGAEAPAEMHILFPDRRALCVAENATHNLHNVLTPRGALVRDARLWSRYLDEAITLFAGAADVAFAQHHWPAWGEERITAWLTQQRDLYGYLHDQTVRLMNQGLTGSEIAERLELPPELEAQWHCRGYYGSVSHNAKAVYQRYMGWYDGHPGRLWSHPPEAAGPRYVALAGGPEALMEQARAAFEAGDLRWVCELTGHLVFADPEHGEARELQARALEQLAYGAENGTWRNMFLMGAHELRHGPSGTAAAPPADFVRHLSTGQLFDVLAIRVDGPRAGRVARIVLRWTFPDAGEQHEMTLERGVLTHRPAWREPQADATISVDRATLEAVLTGRRELPEVLAAGEIAVEGDAAKLGELLGLLDQPDPAFAIVTP
jgi:alkyl sulfatase BDS1-like metallo-beta-lactamase superfamily hydrolase